MRKVFLKILLVLGILQVACTSFKPLTDTSPETLSSKLKTGNVVKAAMVTGDKTKKLKVLKVNPDRLVVTEILGREPNGTWIYQQREIRYADIAKLYKRKFNPTGLYIFAGIFGIMFIYTISIPPAK